MLIVVFSPIHVVVSLCQNRRFVGNGVAMSLCRLAHPASQRVSDVRVGASRPFPPHTQKVGNGSQHVTQSCERPNFCLTISRARTLSDNSQRFDWQATPRFPIHFTGPTSALITTLCPCFFSVEITGPIFLSFPEELKGKSREAAIRSRKVY